MKIRELCRELSGEHAELNNFSDAVFLNTAEKKRLLLQLVNEFKIKRSIAVYALLSTNFACINDAILFLLERNDSVSNHPGKMRHPFVGYLRNNLQLIAQKEQDIEA